MMGPGGSLTPAPSPPPAGSSSRPSTHPDTPTRMTPFSLPTTHRQTIDSDDLDGEGDNSSNDSGEEEANRIFDDDDEREQDEDDRPMIDRRTGGGGGASVVEDDRMVLEDDDENDEPNEEAGATTGTRRSIRTRTKPVNYAAESVPKNNRASTKSRPSRRTAASGHGGPSTHSRMHSDRPMDGPGGQPEKFLDLNGYAGQLTFDPFLELDTITASSTMNDANIEPQAEQVAAISDEASTSATAQAPTPTTSASS